MPPAHVTRPGQGGQKQSGWEAGGESSFALWHMLAVVAHETQTQGLFHHAGGVPSGRADWEGAEALLATSPLSQDAPQPPGLHPTAWELMLMPCWAAFALERIRNSRPFISGVVICSWGLPERSSQWGDTQQRGKDRLQRHSQVATHPLPWGHESAHRFYPHQCAPKRWISVRLQDISSSNCATQRGTT